MCEESPQQIHLLSGTDGTGKSTGLLRIGQHFISKGLTPFLFREDEDLDVGAAASWLAEVPNTVLLFDNCGDFAESLQKLATKCESSAVPLLAIGAERAVRMEYIQNKIAGKFLRTDPKYRYHSLTDQDIDSLIEKLESRGRLGRLTRRTQHQRRRHFKDYASRWLFEGMARLEGGEGFRVRLRQSFNHIEDERLKAIYSAACISYQFGYPLTMGLVSQIANTSVSALQSMLTDRTQDVLVVTPQGVRPRHRITATIVVDSALSRAQKFETVYQLLFSLAPHIDRNASRVHTRYYRLVSRLMDEANIRHLVGYEKGREIYEAIQKAYDWNGRYWEQRALFESSVGNDTVARSYAERSLQISSHPFAYNTLGTILGRIADATGDLDILRESINALRSARDAPGWDTSEHPYVTFFSMMIRFGRKHGLQSIPVTIRNQWVNWHHRARQEFFFSHRRGQRTLETFQRDWLSLAITSDSAAT